MADPRTAGNFLDFLKIFLHNRPQIHGVGGDYALSSQVSGDFSEFRQIERDFPESRPLYQRTGRAADPRTAENFQDSVEIFLHNRPQIRGVRNSTLPPK